MSVRDPVDTTRPPLGGPSGAGRLELPSTYLRRRGTAAVLALIAAACGSGEDDVGVEGWPERWYGQYYEATYVDFDGEEKEIELGVEIPSSYAGHYFYNVNLDAGIVQIDHFNASGSDTGTSSLTPQVDADGLVLLPETGEAIDWPPGGRARAEIRPGSDCSELELETAFTATDDIFVTTLRRGRLCLVVPVDPDDQSPPYTVVVDLCTDDPAPTTCDPI